MKYKPMRVSDSRGLSAGQCAMREAIQNIAVGPDRGRDIPRNLAVQVMRGILSGEIDDVQTAVFLIALRMKRESKDEFLGLNDALLGTFNASIASVDDVLVLADPFDGCLRSVTMTPFIPAVLSACGYHSVMHGVETVGPKHGVTAHKVFKLAGIDVQRNAQSVAAGLSNVGWGYVDQSEYAPALFALQGLRDRVVKRTALTTLERVLAPIRGKLNTHLVLGYVHNAYPDIYATLAKEVGYQSVLLLKGVEGGLAPALNKPLRRFFLKGNFSGDISAEKQLIDLQSLFESSSAALATDTNKDLVQQCLDVGLDTLGGTKSLARDSLCLASAQILIAQERGLNLPKAISKVQLCLDNGSAKDCFNAVARG